MRSGTFADFRDTVARQVRVMHAAFEEPEADWPCVLLVEVNGQLAVGGWFPVAGLDDFGKRRLAEELLPERLRAHNVTRAAFVLPALSGDAESLVLVVAGHRAQALVAPIERHPARAPVLGGWSAPSRPTGLFVEPVLKALADVRSRPIGPRRGVTPDESNDEACDAKSA